MAKVTSKRQITIPKALADRFSIRQGDQVEFVAGADAIHLVPASATREPLSLADRVALFDAASRRQASRQRRSGGRRRSPADRGWTREELYDRGSAG